MPGRELASSPHTLLKAADVELNFFPGTTIEVISFDID